MVIVPALITRAARIDCLPFALNRLAVNPKSVALASAMASFDEETVSTDNIGPITSLLTSGSELSIEPTRMSLNFGTTHRANARSEMVDATPHRLLYNEEERRDRALVNKQPAPGYASVHKRGSDQK